MTVYSISQSPSPRESDAQWQREAERMLRAVGLDVAMRREIVQQTRLHEETDMGCQVHLQAEAEGGGELPRGADGGLVGSLMPTVHIVV